MMGGKNLDGDLAGLYKWIDSFPITRPKRSISRDFSDAVPLAEMLKNLYPRAVEMHNYSPRNSVAQKLVNWQIINKKVLNKLQINLSNAVMEQLAQSVPGVIEKVLFEVKMKVESKQSEQKPKDDRVIMEGLSETMSGSVVPLKQKDSVKTTDHKIVPLNTYLKMETDLLEKDEVISALQNKLKHLESLMTIKDDRINDLTRQLQGVTKEPSSSSLTSSKFLNKFF